MMMSAMTMTAGNSADDGDHGDDGDNSKAPGVVDRRAVDEAPCHRWCQRVKVARDNGRLVGGSGQDSHNIGMATTDMASGGAITCL